MKVNLRQKKKSQLVFVSLILRMFLYFDSHSILSFLSKYAVLRLYNIL